MTIARRTLPLAPLTLLLACGPGSDQIVYGLQADRFANSEWSEPVNLGSTINTAFNDANASLSPDEHTLYFVSNRPGGLGAGDIWASQRQCLRCPWEAPVNLGAPVNSDAAEGSATLSADGRLLFYFSSRPGGGGFDLYVSHRTRASNAGEEWGPPVNLGPDVNTAAAEQGSYYTREGGAPTAVLYFNRAVGTNTDIFKVAVTNDGAALGPAVPVPELNDATGFDQKVAVSTNSLELLLSSSRVGSLGNLDLWVSTRQTPQGPWSTPSPLDAPLNTPDIDSQPNLSRDGRTLIFTSSRPGGSGGTDLWMTTRTH